MVWLKNFVPDALDIALEYDLDPVAIVAAVVKVTQDEQYTLCGLLVEQLQVDFKDHLQQSIVASLVPTYIVRPHVDHENVRHGKCEQRSCLFKCLKGLVFANLTSLCSPRSLLSVPSMSKTRMLPATL
jgi:hypothetical protein